MSLEFKTPQICDLRVAEILSYSVSKDPFIAPAIPDVKNPRTIIGQARAIKKRTPTTENFSKVLDLAQIKSISESKGSVSQKSDDDGLKKIFNIIPPTDGTPAI